MGEPTTQIPSWWQFLRGYRGSCLIMHSLLLIQLLSSRSVCTLNVTDSPRPRASTVSSSTGTPNGTESSHEPVYVRLTGDWLVNVSFDQVTWYRLVTLYHHDWEVAAVVCRDLGMSHPSYTTASFQTVEGWDAVRVFCQGDESTMSECQVDKNNTVYSRPLWSLRVECLPRRAADFDVALLKKYSFLDSGYVLTHLDGRWGPICYGTTISPYGLCDIICRQLGYVRCDNDLYYTDYNIDVSSDPLIRQVECQSYDEHLSDCSYEPLGINESCVYPEDSYLQLGCTHRDDYFDNSYNNPDYDGPEDGYEPSPSMGSSQLFAVIVVLIAVFMVLIFMICRNSGSSEDAEATTPPGRAPRHTVDREEPQQAETLLPSYNAVRNTNSVPGYPTAPPFDGGAIFPPYIPEASPPSAPGYPLSDPASTNLAYPPPFVQNGVTAGAL